MFPHRHPAQPQTRRGFTTPMVAAALLVVMLGFALVLDRLWLEAARVELTTAAEAAALAAAGRLASDSRLIPDADTEPLLAAARDAAIEVARQNRVAGQPVLLDADGGDIRFGHLVEQPAVERASSGSAAPLPSQAVITAHRTRFRGNPVALFLADLTGQATGDVVARAAAGLNNQIAGLRPFDGAPAPAVPLAIWLRDPAGKRRDTWEHCIDHRLGRDDYGYDERTQSVYQGADGLPELTLKSSRRRSSGQDANALVIDIGSGFQSAVLTRQFLQGWSVEDLEPWQGELRLPATVLGLAQLDGDDRYALEQLSGVPRIVLLYSTATPIGRGPTCEVTCERLVAIRVLHVADQPDGSCHVTVQPAVLTTRTAVVATTEDASTVVANPYIYRLQLTQ
uniref:Putative Flp pilus-assembly TadG-like N-terminal domain-containing protein n=1 Tax=Schlesneria paludicola TaxID=360056 RepID=A0A7C2P3V9_9PLAN